MRCWRQHRSILVPKIHQNRIMEASWGVLGASWGVLDASWVRLGGFLGRMWGRSPTLDSMRSRFLLRSRLELSECGNEVRLWRKPCFSSGFARILKVWGVEHGLEQRSLKPFLSECELGVRLWRSPCGAEGGVEQRSLKPFLSECELEVRL